MPQPFPVFQALQHSSDAHWYEVSIGSRKFGATYCSQFNFCFRRLHCGGRGGGGGDGDGDDIDIGMAGLEGSGGRLTTTLSVYVGRFAMNLPPTSAGQHSATPQRTWASTGRGRQLKKAVVVVVPG